MGVYGAGVSSRGTITLGHDNRILLNLCFLLIFIGGFVCGFSAKTFQLERGRRETALTEKTDQISGMISDFQMDYGMPKTMIDFSETILFQMKDGRVLVLDKANGNVKQLVAKVPRKLNSLP